MSKICITGYEKEENCDHCGKALIHGIRLSDGRVVGAICFANKLTAPYVYNGRKQRYAKEYIVKIAKLCQFIPREQWSKWGIFHNNADQFELAQ